MPSEKMTALTMSGPIDRLDGAVRQFVVERPFHPEDAVSFLSGIRRLKPVEAEDVYSPVLARADSLLGRMGLKPEKVEHPAYELDGVRAFIQSLEEELSALEEQERSLGRAAKEELDDPILHCLKDVPESVRDLGELHYVNARLGRLPEEKWPELRDMTAGRPDEFAADILREDGYVYVLALALPQGTDRLDGNLSRLGFERFRPEVLDGPDCTAAELYAQAERERQEDEQRRAELERRRQAVMEEKGPELLKRRAWLAFEAACVRAKGYAARSVGRFYLTGWTPSDEAEALAAEFEAEPGFSCVTASAREVRGANPPVRMRDKGVGRLLTPLMEMYGTPAYGSVDPRWFMVITYTLFFGMMFGDAGQGLCLAILGFALYKKTKTWLWRVIGVCGCSAVIFGLIYGSVFGLEDLLPWGGYHPLESDHIMPVLLAGAAVGVVTLLICMVINVINSLRRGDLQSAFFSPNGVAGAVLYTAVILAVVCAYTGAASLFTGWYIGLFIVLPVLLIWFGEPLAKLLKRQRNWQPDSWGMFIVEGFFDIFESAISYMSNTMSFLRVGAFAISHAGMMMVVSMLSENMAAAGSVIVMVLGNIFVALLEAALSTIQIIRLEFYEIFGRFYVSGGKKFQPVTVNYTG